MKDKSIKKRFKDLLSKTNDSAFDEVKNLEKQIVMERKRKVGIVLKQSAIVALLFVVYTEVLKVDNWILSVLYAIGTIFVFGLITFTIKVVKYVKEKRSTKDKG